jgi:hypothetical protein
MLGSHSVSIWGNCSVFTVECVLKDNLNRNFGVDGKYWRQEGHLGVNG